ncbi:MAG: NAD(P)H-hydrate epimerase, partial [Pseudomonadota bacterium]
MTELLSAAEMRGIEHDAIAAGAVTGLELMERAGAGVVAEILAHWPALAEGTPHAKILCGPGNNGGDGFVIGRLLADRGWQVETFLLGDAARLPPDAAANHARWVGTGATVENLTERNVRAGAIADLYIDAIFGTGLTRPPKGDLLSLLRYLSGSGGDYITYHPRLVAVDAPSGLCLDSGRMLAGGKPEPFSATVPLVSLTVTFEAPKLGHFLADGPAACGTLRIVDLGLKEWRGIRRDAVTGAPGQPRVPTMPRVQLIDRVPLVPGGHLYRHRPPILSKRSGHKYDHGHVLVVAGGQGRTGAARLAARAALRVGAGLVTLAAPAEAMAECAAQLTAIMLREVNDAGDLAKLLDSDTRYNTVCLGPGLGPTGATRDMVRAALGPRRQIVLDADALTAFEGRAEEIFEAIAAITPMRGPQGSERPDPQVVLTPHAGEFRRLFPDIAERWAPEPRRLRKYADFVREQMAAARRTDR